MTMLARVVHAGRRRALEEGLGQVGRAVLAEQGLTAVPGHVEALDASAAVRRAPRAAGRSVSSSRIGGGLASKQYGQSKLQPRLVTMVSANDERSVVPGRYRRSRSPSSSGSSVTSIRASGQVAQRLGGRQRAVVAVEERPGVPPLLAWAPRRTGPTARCGPRRSRRARRRRCSATGASRVRPRARLAGSGRGCRPRRHRHHCRRRHRRRQACGRRTDGCSWRRGRPRCHRQRESSPSSANVICLALSRYSAMVSRYPAGAGGSWQDVSRHLDGECRTARHAGMVVRLEPGIDRSPPVHPTRPSPAPLAVSTPRVGPPSAQGRPRRARQGQRPFGQPGTGGQCVPELVTRLDAELAVDRHQVGLDGLDGDEELLGDLAVGPTLDAASVATVTL